MGETHFKDKYLIASTRLVGHDYSQDGFYFVTICVQDRDLCFGEILNEKMHLSELGISAHECWLEIPSHFPFIVLKEFVVMPNHVHGILKISKNNLSKHSNDNFKNKFGAQSNNLSSVIRGYKIGVTKFARRNNINFSWQERFYDRIIWNDDVLDKAMQYIINNPAKWESEKNNNENLYM
jgi:putative transposase